MDIRIQNRPIPEVEADALVLPGFDKEVPGGTGGWAEEVYASGEFTGKFGEICVLHRPAGFRARRLVLAGCGKQDKFDAAQMRKVVGAAVRSLKARSVKDVALVVDPAHAQAAVEGALLGDFDPDRYQTDETEKKKLAALSLVGAVEQAALDRGRMVADSQNFARELAYEPGNRLTPSALADRARSMAAEAGLECEVIDQDRMRQLGMGALLGVSQGSAEPPCLIVVRYQPALAAPAGAHLGLVGKGVTFDSGGISIKPSDKMEEMRADMAGGAAVLAALRALAALKPSIPVTALVPAVENMPGSRAQRPGDIVRSLSGKTVEVLNTDAEGRLILADALTYAVQLGATHLVDVATLTGAIAVALGSVNVGLFSNSDPLRDRLLDASRAAGEKMWPMPLDEEYREQLKSVFADLQNIGTRYGGAITAALFLKEFVGDTPWAHLDIAGTDWLGESKPFLAKGPSGVAVRTLIQTALGW